MCAKCEAAKGRRTLEIWNKVEKPDYSVLLKVRMKLGVEVLQVAKITTVLHLYYCNATVLSYE